MKRNIARNMTIGTKLSMILIFSILISALTMGIFCISVNEEIAKVNGIIPIVTMVIITSAILFAVSYIFVKRLVSKPLKEITEKSKLLVIGNTDIQIDEKLLRRSDEIGLLGRGFVGIAQNIRAQAEIGNRIAAGDLSVEVKPRSEADVLGISLTAVINNIKRLSS